MSVWILDSGTAGLLDLFRQAARVEITFDPQRTGNDESVVGLGIVQQAFVPQRLRAEFREGPPI